MTNMPHQPYSTLGNHLRFLREQHSESVAEVSGAVEIDEKALERIEAGHERPAEDILLLLISHFNMQDQEAVQLWELAGYEGGAPGQSKAEDLLSGTGEHKPVVVLLGLDARTMYTDWADAQSGPSGVTLAFGQSGHEKHPVPIAKLGMSYEQAEQVLKVLQRAVLNGKYNRGPKALPPANDPPVDA